ncbi:MAG TPA: alpha/beta fold hydrolase [Gemmataceae bacterium]|jgi:pimeloyl-ACP methyl ester carboxylesterase|nr:alpha/beta fold hydrolase [Gemmataceae bacterium]
MKKQIARNVTLEYEDVGHGKPLVLLHGFPFSLQMWRPQAASLQTRYRVITPNLRGFGATDPFDGQPSVEQMAEDVSGLLDMLGIKEPVVLGGLSMGGYVALAFARHHADRLRGLILADTRAEADTAEGKANRDKTIAFAQTHSAREVVEQMLPRLLSERTRQQQPGVAEEITNIAAAQSRTGIVGALQAMRDRPDSLPFLQNISVPAVVIVGQDDIVTPLVAAQNLVQGIGGAVLAVIPEAGHMSNLEQPRAFTEALETFLKTLKAKLIQ